jgi:hypothetical protein
VEITSDVLGGVNMADFTLGEECELQLPPAGSCDLSATFKPSLLGAENATLTLTAKTPGGSSSTLTVQLSGTGGAQQQAAAPTFNPPAGTYNGGQTVAMSSITPNAVIYYTTDGSTPTTSSTQYSTPIGVTASETLNALATAPGYINSTVATAAYTITYTTTGTFTFTGQPAGGGEHIHSSFLRMDHNHRKLVQFAAGYHFKSVDRGPAYSICRGLQRAGHDLVGLYFVRWRDLVLLERYW